MSKAATVKADPEATETTACQGWAERMRLHISLRCKITRKTKGRLMGEIGAYFDMHPSGIHHWLNGNRRISLVQFFQLCEFVKADPAVILLAKPSLSAEDMTKLKDALLVLEKTPV